METKPVELSQELVKRLRIFIAEANNHLMSLSVSGDDILRSAEIMKKATELFKELTEEGKE